MKKFLQSGFEVNVITGDTRGTDWEIGRHIGLLDEMEEKLRIVAGKEFESLPDSAAAEATRNLKVMYHARPAFKQWLVKLLQKQGKMVVVTGNGINDATTLNQAHVGLSMGSDTAMAQEASDITMIDDSFYSFVNAIS